MNKKYSTDELLHKAASYCSMTERCTSEINEKLTLWNASEEEKKIILNRLFEEGFINENRYCSFFVKDKFRFNKWGKIKIRYALKHKNIPEEIIQTSLEEIDDEEYLELLESLLVSKLRTLKYRDEYEKKSKLMKFGLNRGFEMNIINLAISQLKK